MTNPRSSYWIFSVMVAVAGFAAQPATEIYVPTSPGMPFTAETTVVIARHKDGATVTAQMHGIIARDSLGRLHFEDHRYTVDSATPEQSLIRVMIDDPVAGTSTACEIANHICRMTVFQAQQPAANIGDSSEGPIDNGTHLLTSVNLGARTIDGLPATGMRRTTSLAPGVSQAVESWYSPDLHINLSEIRTYPNGDIQSHSLKIVQSDSLKILSRIEPDPSLFAIPAGFTVQDDRKDPTVEGQPTIKLAHEPTGPDPRVPVLIYSVEAEFTGEARKSKINGIVLVNLIVDQNGLPQNVHVVRGLGTGGPGGKPDPKVSKEIADGLSQKAVDAVKQYKFKPAMQDGKPVSVETNVEVNFQMY